MYDSFATTIVQIAHRRIMRRGRSAGVLLRYPSCVELDAHAGIGLRAQVRGNVDIALAPLDHLKEPVCIHNRNARILESAECGVTGALEGRRRSGCVNYRVVW